MYGSLKKEVADKLMSAVLYYYIPLFFFFFSFLHFLTLFMAVSHPSDLVSVSHCSSYKLILPILYVNIVYSLNIFHIYF